MAKDPAASLRSSTIGAKEVGEDRRVIHSMKYVTIFDSSDENTLNSSVRVAGPHANEAHQNLARARLTELQFLGNLAPRGTGLSAIR